MHVSALVCILAAVSSACAEPVVTPKHQQVVTPGTAVVRCVFQQPLLDCRVRVTDQYQNNFDQTLDFGKGPRSPSVELRKSYGSHVAAASYAGDGLAAGHCGASVALEWNSWPLVVLVECHGLTEDRGWSRGFGLVTAFRSHPVLAVTARTPRLVVAAPGSQVRVLFRTPGAISRCFVRIPAAGEMNLSPGQSFAPLSRYRPHGAGLWRGECGATLSNVTRQDAGVWWLWGVQGEPTAMQATVVVVSVAPEAGPVLTVADPGLRVGSQLSATCRAPPGAPPAKLTWLLDGKVVRQDDGNDAVSTSLPWDEQASVQTFRRLLTEGDVGKRLKCRADHQAGSWSGSDSWQIPAAQSTPTQSAPTPEAPTEAELAIDSIDARRLRRRASGGGDKVGARVPRGV